MIYDRQWFLDVRAKLDEASALKETPPQNEVKPQPEPAYSYTYSSDDQPVADYGMYAGFGPTVWFSAAPPAGSVVAVTSEGARTAYFWSAADGCYLPVEGDGI